MAIRQYVLEGSITARAECLPVLSLLKQFWEVSPKPSNRTDNFFCKFRDVWSNRKRYDGVSGFYLALLLEHHEDCESGTR